MPDGDTPSNDAKVGPVVPPLEKTPAAAVAPNGPSPSEPTKTSPLDPLRHLAKRLWPGAGSSAVTLNGSHTDIVMPVSPEERDMRERIVAFQTKRVGDIAIPRTDIIGIDASADLTDMLKQFSEANHSRLPVYRGDLDDPLGFVHIKDVVGMLAEPDSAEGTPRGEILSDLTRKALYVPPSMPVTDLLLRMQASRIHMALVIDEYGGTDGLVTIEDLIELIVGDIRDEHDEPEEIGAVQVTSGQWEVDARAELAELADLTRVDLRLEDHDADTLGGLVYSLAGRIPLRGEVICHPEGHEFDIKEADPRRIRKIGLRLGVRRPADPSPCDDEASSAK